MVFSLQKDSMRIDKCKTQKNWQKVYSKTKIKIM